MALATYWALFIIAPVAVSFYLLGASASVVCIFVLLCVLGERGYRYWKKLWKVGE